MKKTFEMESRTEVFINANGGISIKQDGDSYADLVVFCSKSRAIQVAKAILEMAKIASFKAEEENA